MNCSAAARSIGIAHTRYAPAAVRHHPSIRGKPRSVWPAASAPLSVERHASRRKDRAPAAENEREMKRRPPVVPIRRRHLAPTGFGLLTEKAIVRARMGRNRITRPVALAVFVLTPLLALIGMAGTASGYPVQYCSQIPIVGGIPPWGFHTGAPITGASGSYARGHGEINLAANTVSGILCQVNRVRNQPDRLITMTVDHRLVYHSHHAVLWGVPGNIMKIVVRVQSSTDPQCQVGTVGRVTLYASYNGVRSDSVQFTFPAGCADHDHLYHGPQVNNQVPPL
jgi:hypothetical protein